jgi:5'-3' exonuclease
MKAIVDADSLIYASCFKETIEECYDTFVKSLESIKEDLNEYCDIDEYLICNGSKNNFRIALNTQYKANRGEKPKFLYELHELVKKNYNSYWGDGVETDDVVATLWKNEVDRLDDDSVIIVANDKDYKQFSCWYFDAYYKRRTLDKIEPLEALKNFYTQMIVGDSADNIKVCLGYGKVAANKLLYGVKSELDCIKRVYGLYLELYGADAKRLFKETHKLLKLRTDANSEIRIGL